MSAIGLRIKSAIVASPLDGIAHQIRWLSDFRRRQKHPELWEVYLEQPRLPLILRRLLRPDSNVVDIGCHIGSFSSQILKICPNGRHVAIEASPAKAERLRKKFPGIEIFNVAVGAFAGRATFEDNISDPGFSRLLGSHQPNASNLYYEVDVQKLDDI